MASIGKGTGAGGPEYRQGGQQESSMGMGVPVKWVKQQLPGSERVYQVRTVMRDGVVRVGMADEREAGVFPGRARVVCCGSFGGCRR